MATQPNDPTVQPGPGPAAEHTDAAPMPGERVKPPPAIVEPSDAEIEEWAERVRKRREAWLGGPTQEERAAWVRRERERRLAELKEEEEQAKSREQMRSRQRYLREAQLAAEGAVSLFFRWWYERVETLERAGREWEDDFTQRSRRRRIPLEDEPMRPPTRRQRIPIDDDAV